MASQAEATPSPLPDHISHNYVIFLGIGSMMTFLSTLLVTARFLSRWFTWSVKWDDWACLGALIFAYGFLTTTALVATVGRAGYHLDQYNYSVLERYLQIALANNVLYNVSISLTKLSILLFYRRIFAISKGFRIAIWVVGGVVAGYFVSAVCGLIFAASPVEAQWKVWLPHTTINNKPFWVSMGIINALLDFTLLCLPQPLVWRLHQTQRRKILLSMVFLLGCFVCIASVVRLYFLATMKMDDVTYSLTTPGIWTLMEMNTGIICSCLPMLPSLVQHFCSSDRRNSKWSSAGSSRPLYLGSGNSTENRTALRHGLHTDIESLHPKPNHAVAGSKAVRVQTDLQVNWDSASS